MRAIYGLEVNCISNAWLLPRSNWEWCELVVMEVSQQSELPLSRWMSWRVLTQNFKSISNKQLVMSNIISYEASDFIFTNKKQVSLKTRRPPAVVDKKITRQKKLIMGFLDVAQFMLFCSFSPPPRLKSFIIFSLCRCFYGSQSCVRNVAANSAPALISNRSIVYFVWSFFGAIRWKISCLEGEKFARSLIVIFD